VLRVLLSPRWVGLTLLMIAAVLVCGRLGVWQWDRAHPDATFEHGREAASALPGVLDRPDGGSGVPAGALVRGSGRYDPDPAATTTVDQALDGRAGQWVLTPLVLDDDRRVLVLRGWSPPAAKAAALAPTPAAVVVTGRLEPAGTSGVDEMFVALTEQQPADAGDLTPVPFAPAPADSQLQLLNALYALQWWTFSLFWVWLWWRMLREDLDDARKARSVHASATV
jgi:surfeit locus 1 family protein